MGQDGILRADWKSAQRRVNNPPAGATDMGRQTGRLIFDIGGNKYRLIASVDFKEQLLVIERVLTHEDYRRERL